MRLSISRFLLGLAAGAALTMAIVNVGAIYLARKEWLEVHGGLWNAVASLPKSAFYHNRGIEEHLPLPWFPGRSSTLHDQWTIHPPRGKPVSLPDFRGKVVFLNFWATTCGPCIGEMASIERLSDSLKTESVEFLAVTQEEEQAVLNFLQKAPLRIPVYLAGEDLPDDFKLQGVPTTFILNREGVAVYRYEGMANWDKDSVRKFIRDLELK